MGLTDILFGRKKLKEASPDRLFALSTAQVSLEHELGVKPAGAAAVTFKPLSAGEFAEAEKDMQELLEVAARESGSTLDRSTDAYGFGWVVVRDPDFEDLVTAVHLVSAALLVPGFGPQLLATIFRFNGAERPPYGIYRYRRHTFWPFIRTGSGQELDNSTELELQEKLEKELPSGEDITRWYGLFDAPL